MHDFINWLVKQPILSFEIGMISSLLIVRFADKFKSSGNYDCDVENADEKEDN